MLVWLDAWEKGALNAATFDARCRVETGKLFEAAFLEGLRVKRPWRDILLGPERAKLKELLARQFGFWESFVGELETAQQSAAGFTAQDTQRLEAYTLPARAAFEWALVMSAHKDALFYWDLARAGTADELPGQQSCDKCRELAAASPLRKEQITFVPGEGFQPCGTGCSCHIRIKEL